MPKYTELVKAYAADIEKIKKLKQRADELRAEAGQIKPVLHPVLDVAAIQREEALFEQSEALHWDAMVLLDKLDQDIQAEYHGVPFAGPRKAGIEAFYRESGLRALFPTRS